MEYKKKLIEVALPLEAINAESAREKSIRHGHPSTLHLWWARRPLATARAVIWSSLVDDPSSHPDMFPTEELQKKERERLFGILSRLVLWENSNDSSVMAEAKVEIMRSTGGNPPALLDPFSGGGAIPLEAQRLGLEAHAHDLNPVSIMLNKSMIEVPALFAMTRPVNPAWNSTLGTPVPERALGLSEDVRYYGSKLKKAAFEKIGQFYPKVGVSSELGGGEATVIAWIWARTVKCPNPACNCIMPLVKSFTLSKKKGTEAYIQTSIHNGEVQYSVKQGKNADTGTVNRTGAKCISCGTAVPFSYIREQGKQGKMGAKMIAIAAEGRHGRIYVTPDKEQLLSATSMSEPDDQGFGDLANYPGYLNPPAYGITRIQDLFSKRQLSALLTFSECLKGIQNEVYLDALKQGYSDVPMGLASKQVTAKSYSEAVVLYLSFAIDKLADRCSTICGWDSSRDGMRNTFGLSGMSMSWDYAEVNPFSNSSGCFDNMLEWVEKCIARLPANREAFVKQWDAQSDCGLRGIMVSTDPPYYSNVPYADFSDFFFVWLRKNLGSIYPDVFRTLLTPKSEELVADPYRQGGKEQAAQHFENGMLQACRAMYACSSSDIPVTIYYAFKQHESDGDSNNEAGNSTGWETMLSAIIQSGFLIDGTWPMRTEMANRSRSNNSNALASSIVLVCRKRSKEAKSITRREFINSLHREMRPALEALQSASIAPVDLAQSAIGPGIGVFSRYKNVIEADGSPMSVRAALQIINQELDAFYNEQEGELDSKSRFCVDIFNQYAFNTLKFGDADILARAKNTSVQALVDEGVMEASKGTVRLKTREEIPEKVDGMEDCCWKITQQLARAMEKGGIKETATVVSQLKGYIAENAKQLAYRLYTICERKNWAAEGYAYNNLIVAWPDIQSEASRMQAETPVQMNMFDNV